jgi:hypothetical protein
MPSLALACALCVATPVAEPTEDDAPTSPSTAVWASFTTVTAGVAIGLGVGEWLVPDAQKLQLDPAARIFATGLSVLLIGAGANLGDLLNGDLERFLTRGGIRLGVVALAAIGIAVPGPLLIFTAIAALYYLPSTIYELFTMAGAPERWAQRERERLGSTLPHRSPLE